MKANNLLQTPITDVELLKKLLPHREPMIMVDSLLFFSENKAISSLLISEKNIFVENGFFSETGLIEHMAQTAALHIGYKNHSLNSTAEIGFIGSIKSFNLSSIPNVGDTITTEIEIVYDIATMKMVKIETLLNNIKIANAEMTTVLKEGNV